MKHYRKRGEGKRESTDNNINNGKEKSGVGVKESNMDLYIASILFSF